jgi:branched-chain amino acid transport system permease protein
MFHRESGVYKTTYASDMALYPLPIARWTVAAFIVLFAAILPLSLHDYYLSIINLSLIAIVGAWGNILVLHRRISVRQAAFMSVSAYGRQPCRAPPPAVLGDAAGGQLMARCRRHRRSQV